MTHSGDHDYSPDGDPWDVEYVYSTRATWYGLLAGILIGFVLGVLAILTGVI